MLRSLKQLYGDKLGAPDGDIGHVRDFYFDDHDWAIRYVIADTGSWHAGRSVLLSPHSFGNLYANRDCLLVNLTRKQIEDSPHIDLHKPVSRQYEEAYFQYYGLPSYWNGMGVWGGAPFPMAPLPPDGQSGRAPHGNDPHLRSAQAVGGYSVRGNDGEIGKVSDFMIDDASWTVCYVVVESGQWFSSKAVVVPPDQIESISYTNSEVVVKGTRETILSASEYHMPRATYHDAGVLPLNRDDAGWAIPPIKRANIT